MRLIACLLALLTAPALAQSDDYEGDWSGVLSAGAPLRLVLEVRGETAVLISVDQSGARLPLEITQRDAEGFAGTIPSVGAALDLNRTGNDELSGTFRQGGATLPLSLYRGNAFEDGGDVAADFIVMSGDVRLAGTLLLPEGDGPFPAILLLNGSGSQDRDANVAGQPGFAVLADSLAERGIATLRMDDRGIGGSDAVAPDSPADLAVDAGAALSALREADGIDNRCAGILGHSEGGMIAFLAADSADPAFIISLAGMHMTMAETLYDQSEAIILVSGGTQAQADQNRALQDAIFAIMRDETIEDHMAAMNAALVELGLPEAVAGQQATIWAQPYARAALDLDTASAMAAYEGPVHAFFAGMDLQVRGVAHADRLIAARGDQPTEVTYLGGLNHLFQRALTGLPQEYASAPHAMAPEALAAIGEAAEALINQACR
ncbi:alpha/beta hydrolase [Hyphobacterium sp. HN65]|uniref:Alpha/beta hydrolase n=1 Tax=Hyphobacterium lacteum TaxID=3116575 RepID=A0ABU7LRL3_9PROT|nr:alpha/beta hydrolase [Hyphobacterium sp. HN65]MEE2526538.1 alpha/beta hydrolase [Hyphobacterium sp. HN65]